MTAKRYMHSEYDQKLHALQGLLLEMRPRSGSTGRRGMRAVGSGFPGQAPGEPLSDYTIVIVTHNVRQAVRVANYAAFFRPR